MAKMDCVQRKGLHNSQEQKHRRSSMTQVALSTTDIAKTFNLGFLGALRPFKFLAQRMQLKGIAHSVEAVKSISVEVNAGEIFGFLGPNGAGKTTTIKMLMGLVHPTRGTGTLLGAPLGDRAARARLGFLPEHPYFYEHLKPLEFLDFYGRLFRMTARERKQRAEYLVDRVGLRHAVDRPLRKYSKGMIQRIGIAQALINEPDLVVFDEPMSGLDPMGRKDVRDIIFELREKGTTVFLSSHILQDVEMICDRVAIVVDGRIRSEGALEDLLEEPIQRYEVVFTGLDNAALEVVGALAAETRAVAGRHTFTVETDRDLDAFVRVAQDAGGRIVSATPIRQSLEALFVAEATRAEDA